MRQCIKWMELLKLQDNTSTNNIIIVSGGFDPIHSGHIAMINNAAQYGQVVVAVNSDEWLARKKGRSFMPFKERVNIIANLKNVYRVISFDDRDNTAIDAINRALEEYPTSNVIFANGGDRNDSNVPEQQPFVNNSRVSFLFGVGGEFKMNSSSWILEEWKAPKVERPWGWYRVLDKGENWAVKELTILPGKSLSDQRHHHRSEHWHVVSGQVTCDLEMDGWAPHTLVTGPKQSMDIEKLMWHRPYNTGTEPAKIIETWFGDVLEESDIERR